MKYNKQNKKRRNNGNRYSNSERQAQADQRARDKISAKKQELRLQRTNDLGNFISGVAATAAGGGVLGYSMQSMDFYFAVPSIFIGCSLQLLSFYIKSK